MSAKETKIPPNWFINMRHRYKANTGKDFAGTDKDMKKIYESTYLLGDITAEDGDLELEAMKEWRKKR